MDVHGFSLFLAEALHSGVLQWGVPNPLNRFKATSDGLHPGGKILSPGSARSTIWHSRAPRIAEGLKKKK